MERIRGMPEWVYVVGMIVTYVVLMRWVLPAMGVPT